MEIADIISEHTDWIKRKARCFYSDRADAEDLASETIFRCLSEGSRYDDSRCFKPWAYTIMTNIYKVQYNRRKCVLFSGYDDAGNALSDIFCEQYAIIRSFLSVIRKCARRSRCVECVLLYAKGYDYAEIAERLNIPVGTVKSRISAGRALLKTALSV